MSKLTKQQRLDRLAVAFGHPGFFSNTLTEDLREMISLLNPDQGSVLGSHILDKIHKYCAEWTPTPFIIWSALNISNEDLIDALEQTFKIKI